MHTLITEDSRISFTENKQYTHYVRHTYIHTRTNQGGLHCILGVSVFQRRGELSQYSSS